MKCKYVDKNKSTVTGAVTISFTCNVPDTSRLTGEKKEKKRKKQRYMFAGTPAVGNMASLRVEKMLPAGMD